MTSSAPLPSDIRQRLKWGVWAYFLLLIFEGAFRKWFLPSLATPLLVVRDPIAIWVLYQAWRLRLLPRSPYMLGMTIIGFLGLFTALLVGHGSLPVALFGARMFLIHWPLMFAIGVIFDQDDVLRIGRTTLWMSMPMAVLIALQFYSPQNAWVNQGVGGDEAGAGFSGALGYFRPPGVFSFTNGNTLFFGFVACFLLYFWLDRKGAPRILLFGASLALLASIPLSISRTLLFEVVASLGFLGLAVSRRPQYLTRLLTAAILIIAMGMILQNVPFFQKSMEVLSSRFTSADKVEGGLEGTLGDRYLGGLAKALEGSVDQPIWGYGMGMGTNVGSTLLSGEKKFLIAEEEWGRLVGEMGSILGISAILLRVLFSVGLFTRSYRHVVAGDVLPWMLMSFAFLIIAEGQWAQPTSLGFSTLIGGLVLASLQKPPPS